MPLPLTFIDLFCGCGGFSLGLQHAGFKGLAAIDFNHEAIQVFAAYFKSKFLPVLRAASGATNQVWLIGNTVNN